jgi:hypothetical protein
MKTNTHVTETAQESGSTDIKMQTCFREAAK